ncbi:hypothetical protein M409DRAFT_62946 [Zasmidium cellare ATCC 36951]|uniref:1-phosphatidylinositol-3-phosphate 5-kinase n=1 Tax=Zasmidium cellare ATCC 36951 TaxID=1080233 RepID=A0A6A6CZK4_ZASCE|nr:uncharacterized protein M409DRAFT_62946 [Zasmidium cellare ATCC 36951]KAF2172183.1 hypothetical protein M409DRAFT_62946 [Zasmidium cellare ATCC 36951]
MAPESSSPAASTTFLPFLNGRSRRGSLASITSRHGAGVDKDVLAQALDDIHTEASKSETLTSFHDFDGEGGRGTKEIVSNGVSGIYNRLKQSVGGGTPQGKESKSRPKSSASKDSLETESQQSTSPAASRTGLTVSTKKPTPDAASVATTTSPITRTFTNGDDAGDSTQPGPKLHTADGQPIPSFTSEQSHKRPFEELSGIRTAKAHQVTATKQDLDMVLSPRKEVDSKDMTADTLAKVLSNRDAPAIDKAKLTRGSRLQDEDLEQAIDDSDYADGPEDPLPAPKAAKVNGNSGVQSDDVNEPMDAQRPPMPRVGVSHLPGFDPSRASSTTGGADTDSISSSHTAATHRPALEQPPNLNTGLQRRRTFKAPPGSSQALSVPSNLRRKVLSKEFWMKDDNARVCFACGQTFSTFRRKHHCRTCGQIFDARCTNLVPGKPFGQVERVRLCKPCEEIIFGSDDDSTVFSEEDDYMRSPLVQRFSEEEDEVPGQLDGPGFSRTDTEVTTPSIGIPASRRNREAKRRSAVIEFDSQPALARPSSAHSLASLSRRPRSSSHRRRHSRHQPIRGLRSSMDERGPFHCEGDPDKKSSLPNFHNDNIIDPDLAAFLSDDGSEDDESPNIMSAVTDGHTASPGDRERLGFGGFLSSALRTGRSKTGDKSMAPSSTRGIREDEILAYGSKQIPRVTRSRNLSNGSMSHGRPSPRRSRSNLLLATDELDYRPSSPLVAPNKSSAKVVCSSALYSLHSREKDDLDLYPASYAHVKQLLAQLLRDANIAHALAWEKALMPIIMQCTDDVDPDVQQGDDMDIRHYIKLKKVPSGRPGDTSYVSGIVFSKNVALKTMARSISNPRIVIVTFAIEYARYESHFMSLEPVIAQEQEYLENLVNRIAALRPTVLLVQRHVSGLALHMLERAGITVAYNIKESVLAAVARVTQTTMIKSIDKLGIDPSHLGRCDSFEVKTFVSDGMRKTYIYLSGCDPDLGCTIVLRGADTKTLRAIKRVTEFMCYVAYNLKLENYLMRDEFVSIPHTVQKHIEAHDDPSSNRDIEPRTLEEKQKTLLETLGHIVGDEETNFKYEGLEQETRKRILSASPFVVFMQPYILTQLRDLERRLHTYKLLRDRYAEADEEGGDEEEDESALIDHFKLVEPEMVNAPPSKDQPKAVREYLHAVHDAQFEKAKHTFDLQERQWDSFVTGDVNPFDPFSHQKIVVLYSTVSSITSAPCTGPELLGIGFYAGYTRVEDDHDEDIPLGQYIEDLCLSSSTTCKDCHKKMYDHHRQYVHGYGQLSISIQRQSAKMRGYANTLLMWSTCRICRHETTVTQMSEHTWKYSFAKYLELSFWSSPLHPRAGLCKHDIHKDFLRCFGFQDMVVRVQYDPIDIYEVIVPRGRVTWKVEADLTVKNDQYLVIEKRLEAFTESVKKRLASINLEALEGKKSSDGLALLEKLKIKAEDDQQELRAKLKHKYASSRYFELIPLNRALRFMDEKAIEWDEEFANFERDYFPSETDIRKIAAVQLRNMFVESQPSAAASVASDVSDTEEGTEMALVRKPGLGARRPTADEILSEKAHDVLSSVVEEHKANSEEHDSLKAVKSNDTEATIGVDLSTQTSTPRKDQEEAVERDDVKHLDLAVSSRSPGESSNGETASQYDGSPSPKTGTNVGSPDEPFATQPKPLSSGLLERIEQIRSTRAVAGAEGDTLESKIPRLADLKKRDASPKPEAGLKPPDAGTRPPLLRAKSQPGHPGHGHTRSADLTTEHSIDSVASGAPANGEAPPVDKRLTERLGVGRLANKVSKVTPSFIPRSIPAKNEDSSVSGVSALARHFEMMSREFERERLRERRQRAMRSRQARANPLASSRPVVEVYQNAVDAVGERVLSQAYQEKDVADDRGARKNMDDYVASSQPEDLAVAEDGESVKSTTTGGEGDPEQRGPATDTDVDTSDLERTATRSRDTSDPTSGMSSSIQSPTHVPDMEGLGPELSIPEHRKNVWFKYLAEFWSKRSASGWSNLEYPLHASEHVFEDSDIIVREDEPSSVIALSLACKDYEVKLKEFRNHPSKAPLAKHGHAHTHSQASATNPREELREEIEASLLSDTGTHLKYSFAHGQVKASCKIFYAESFDALRRKCGVSDRFMESMSRCLKFDSKGGKTKSLFLRTLDNRFIIKSLQEVELKAFTKFAPDYFNFMSYTLFHGVPSVIAKMFGLFQVNIRNPATGVDFSYYLLVMENLFYERNPNRRFDLKGSMRNRKIESTGQADEVLLDENLVETIFESPLFVREHSRKLLQASVFNDTLWLCKQNVMDYSLMAGFDDARKELVVGIIDCIRTYTWDKKLESWIKDRGKNKPTITSPKDYRNRFRVSMMQYVLQAPNCWHQFQVNMAPPKTLKEEVNVREELMGDEGVEVAA